jgi:hypothetical protein
MVSAWNEASANGVLWSKVVRMEGIRILDTGNSYKK